MSILSAKRFLCLLGLILVVTSCEPDEPFTLAEDTNGTVEVVGSADAPEGFQQLLNKVNELRSTGCSCGNEQMPPVGSLRWNAKMAAAATQHSKDMANNAHFSHTGTDGSSAGDRLKQQGYNWQTYGENIAHGYTSVSAVFEGWKDSPGHCRNLMNASFSEMGAAVDNRYWTQVLGASL